MQSKETTNFSEFLKKLYWSELAGFNIYRHFRSLNSSAHHAEKRRPDNSFKTAIDMHLASCNSDPIDPDEYSSSNWLETVKLQKELLIAKPTVGRNAKEYFNSELNPHAHISKLFAQPQAPVFKAKMKKKEIALMAPIMAKAVGAIAVAVVMTIAISHSAPATGVAITQSIDRLLVNPIFTVTYIFGGEQAQALVKPSDLPQNLRPSAINKPIDKNVLKSYIMDNQGKLNGKTDGEMVYIVKPNELDGRVAGKTIFQGDEPSSALISLSTSDDSGWQVKKSLKNFLHHTVILQKDLADKLETSLMNLFE